MSRQKYHCDLVYQTIGEPSPGAIGVGYVRYNSDLQSATSIISQRRLINQFSEQKGWKLVRWYEEPERSASHESDELLDQRPVFAQLLKDAGTTFHVVVCACSKLWAHSMDIGYASLTRFRRARVWWCTADGLWNIDAVQHNGIHAAFAVDE